MTDALRDAVEQARQEAGTEGAKEALSKVQDFVETTTKAGGKIRINSVIAWALLATLVALVMFMWRKGVEFSPTPSSFERVGSVLDLGASLTVEYVLKTGDLDYSLRYRGAANMWGNEITGDLRGDGGGDYLELSVSTAPTDSCTIKRWGPVKMQGGAHPDTHTVDFTIVGSVERAVDGKPDCDANVEKGNNVYVTCGFENVNLATGGTYHGIADEPLTVVDTDLYQGTCTLDLSPLSVGPGHKVHFPVGNPK